MSVGLGIAPARGVSYDVQHAQEALVRVPAEHLGVKRLKAEVAMTTHVFCVCQIARRYQVGSHDAAAILADFTVSRGREDESVESTRQRAVAEGRKLRRVGHARAGCDEALYVPITLSEQQVEVHLQELGTEHAAICSMLTKAFADFEPRFLPPPPGERPAPPPAVRERVLLAFETLLRWGYLPAGVGNALFSPLAIVMLIAECFGRDQEAVIAYLRDPQSILPETKSATPSAFFLSFGGRGA